MPTSLGRERPNVPLTSTVTRLLESPAVGKPARPASTLIPLGELISPFKPPNLIAAPHGRRSDAADTTGASSMGAPSTARPTVMLDDGSRLKVDPTHQAHQDRNLAPKTPRKLGALSSLIAPRVLSPVTPKASESASSLSDLKRKLVELDSAHPHSTAPQPHSKQFGITSLQGTVRLDNIEVDKDDRNAPIDTDLGIGISPRRKKVKWTGNGEPPLSMRLASSLATEASAVTLFYASLRRTHAKRTNPIDTNNLALTHTHSTALTHPALDHIRTAPIRLKLLYPASTRSHVGHLWRAGVLRWPTADTTSHVEVWLNLAVPKFGFTDLSVDPRTLLEKSSRVDNLGKHHWEVGVWAEYNLMDFPIYGEGDNDEMPKEVLFATRYLVVDRSSRE